MDILDIHTHSEREGAIVSCVPSAFLPRAGMYYSVGIHPWTVSPSWQEEWECLLDAASRPEVLAVGEAGLDKATAVDMALQQAVFERQARLADALGKPLVIHCVRAFNELIVCRRKLAPSVAWVVHGFRGNRFVAAGLCKEGFYLSFGERYREDVLSEVPLERMLMETDESKTGIHVLYRRMAAVLGMDEESFEQRIRGNIADVFFKG